MLYGMWLGRSARNSLELDRINIKVWDIVQLSLQIKTLHKKWIMLIQVTNSDELDSLLLKIKGTGNSIIVPAILPHTWPPFHFTIYYLKIEDQTIMLIKWILKIDYPVPWEALSQCWSGNDSWNN